MRASAEDQRAGGARLRRLMLDTALGILVLIAAGCGASHATRSDGTPDASGRSVPALTLLNAQGAIAFVHVSVAGRDYLFRIDSGAVNTVIPATLAQALHLPSAGRPLVASPLGCHSVSRPVTISSWRIGNVQLPTMTVYTQSLATHLEGHYVPPIGLLGADLLARFGSVSIDFRTHRLILGTGPVNGGYHIPIELRHVARTDGLFIGVDATIGAKRRRYALDTGSDLPLLDEQALPALGLRPQGASRELAGATGCTFRVKPIRVTNWRLGNQRLPTTNALAANSRVFEALGHRGIDGIIGLGALGGFGLVTIDFNAHQLVLGGTLS